MKNHQNLFSPELGLKALGTLVRTERKARGLNQTELAHLAGVGLNFVGQIEAGKSTAHIGRVLSLLQALGLELRTARGRKGLSVE